MSYGFTAWRDFFNDRQLLALGWLDAAIAQLHDEPARAALSTLFSGVLEFNNMFASYKGEGTGAVRHMFRITFSSRNAPRSKRIPGARPKAPAPFPTYSAAACYGRSSTVLAPTGGQWHGRPPKAGLCPAFQRRNRARNGRMTARFYERGIYLSCGDSASTGLPPRSIDLIVTDPPFFDNVHYSELADFFHAWQQLRQPTDVSTTTRSLAEVQDSDADSFAEKLQGVFRECGRILKDDGLLVFTYHHSRDEGWTALAEAILGRGSSS